MFTERLSDSIRSKGTPCVVGLDPNPDLMPSWFSGHCAQGLYDYCRIVIDAVADLAPVVKPQSAFFEAYGSAGIVALERVMAYARSKNLLVLLDVKRGDIGSTSEAYAQAYLGNSTLQADAVTLNPYLGPDTLEPFVKAAYENRRGIFVIAMTSNPGARHLQHLVADGIPVYEHVAKMVAQSIRPGDRYSPLGIVAGATYPEEAARLRALLPNSFFLIPGLGAQGGNPALLGEVFDSEGMGAIVSSSRAVMYPKGESHDEASLSALIRDTAAEFIAEVGRVWKRS